MQAAALAPIQRFICGGAKQSEREALIKWLNAVIAVPPIGLPGMGAVRLRRPVSHRFSGCGVACSSGPVGTP